MKYFARGLISESWVGISLLIERVKCSSVSNSYKIYMALEAWNIFDWINPTKYYHNFSINIFSWYKKSSKLTQRYLTHSNDLLLTLINQALNWVNEISYETVELFLFHLNRNYEVLVAKLQLHVDRSQVK